MTTPEMATTMKPNLVPGPDLLILSPEFYMRPLTREDATDRYTSWFNDPELQKILGRPVRNWTNEQAADHIAKFNYTTDIHLGIFPIGEDLPVGYMTITVRPNKSASMIVAYGEPEYRNIQALRPFQGQFMKFFFYELGMRKMVGNVHEKNKASMAICNYFGFKLDGILREHYREKDGSFANERVYSLLKSDWIEHVQNMDPELLASLNIPKEDFQ